MVSPHVQHGGQQTPGAVRRAFKADTSDTRESPALAVAGRLLEEHARWCCDRPLRARQRARRPGRRRVDGSSSNAIRSPPPGSARPRRPDRLAAVPDHSTTPDLRLDGQTGVRVRRPQPARPAALFELGFNVFAVGKTPRKHYMNGSLGH